EIKGCLPQEIAGVTPRIGRRNGEQRAQDKQSADQTPNHRGTLQAPESGGCTCCSASEKQTWVRKPDTPTRRPGKVPTRGYKTSSPCACWRGRGGRSARRGARRLHRLPPPASP